MPINTVVFQGPANAPGNWYGKLEQRNNQETLVLFKGVADRSTPQKLKDKINNVHKGEKLANEFIKGNHIKINDPLTNSGLLNQYLSAGQQNFATLTKVAEILDMHPQNVNGHVNLAASLYSNTADSIRGITIIREP
jgi:plasmid maintenance system antidote protein VapI